MARPGREPTVSDEAILRLFLESPDPAFTASEFTDDLDMSRQGIRDRLEKLEENGYLTSKMSSGRRIWWITTKGKEKLRD